MGKMIHDLLLAFSEHAIDPESCAVVTAMAASPTTWNAAHAVFDEVRSRLNRAGNGTAVISQYAFEEYCAKAMFNATDTPIPFHASSAFFVVPAALAFAKALGLDPGFVAATLGS